MYNIIKIIDYSFKAKKGINNTSELATDISFGPLEGLFIISFILFGIIVLGLGFVAFHFISNIALFFAILFLAVLVFDIWLFVNVKLFFKKLSKNVVDLSKRKYKSIKSNNVIDIEYE